jgi:hypothetical protein
LMDVPRARETSDHLPLLSVLDIPDEPLPASVVSELAGIAGDPDADDDAVTP